MRKTRSENAEYSRQTGKISTLRGTVRGVLYPVEGTRAAMVMVGGAGGDTAGPAGIYDELAIHLQTRGAEALRLEYRTPNQLDECVYDLLAGIEALGQRGVEREVLVGWSFGGAVVISAGAESDDVVGVATVASQSYGAEAVGELSPEKSLLLIHGTADRVLPYELSERLYAQAGEPKELVLYPDDGHGVERHRSEMLEKLHGWSRDLLLDRSEPRPEEG
jgi:dienelactone hydrolase